MDYRCRLLFRSRCRWDGRDNLVIRVSGRGENHVNLASRESCQSRVDFDVDRGEFAKFLLEDFQVPARVESDPDVQSDVAGSFAGPKLNNA